VGEVVRSSKLTIIIIILATLVGAASACNSGPTQTPPPTRGATQTPWIIYVPVTSTPEAATVTPLPTVTAAAPARTATKPPPTKAPVSVATKAPPPLVSAAPTASPAPACNLGTVTPVFPENGAPRTTRADGSGGSAIIFKWQPPGTLSGVGDPHVGYMIQIESHRSNLHINGDTMFISQNKYAQDGQFTYDPRAVSSLAAGDSAVATWSVTIVKTSGSFNDNDYTARPPDLVNCGSASLTMAVQLIVN
jgi:hypothetical protein